MLFFPYKDTLDVNLFNETCIIIDENNNEFKYVLIFGQYDIFNNSFKCTDVSINNNNNDNNDNHEKNTIKYELVTATDNYGLGENEVIITDFYIKLYLKKELFNEHQINKNEILKLIPSFNFSF